MKRKGRGGQELTNAASTSVAEWENQERIWKSSRWSKKFQVVKGIEVPERSLRNLVEAECPLGAISQAEMSWRQRNSVLVDTSPESKKGHNTKHGIF